MFLPPLSLMSNHKVNKNGIKRWKTTETFHKSLSNVTIHFTKYLSPVNNKNLPSVEKHLCSNEVTLRLSSLHFLTDSGTLK